MRDVFGLVLLTAALGCSHRNAVPLTSSNPAPILLFNGTGAWPNDVKAVEAVLEGNHLRYSTAGSAELNDLSEARLQEFRLLIVPGGNFEELGNGLEARTSAKVRGAVQRGLSYLGICAGAFFAGDSPYNGLNLTAGTRFGFYSAEWRGVRKAAVPISLPNGSTLEQYWEDGPQLAGWGAAVAKYPDGMPAVAQGAVGKGWVVLSGFHPEAPESWRHGLSFTTPVSDSNAYAGTLVHAALERAPLPQF
jgi:hypothetical protein